MNDDDRALCAATAGLLRAGGTLALWGLALSVISALVLALTGRSLPSAAWAAFAVVALIALPERYLAMRVRLEAALFDGLAGSMIASGPSMDRALATLGLRRRADGTRPLVDRVFEARQLMQRHGIAVIAQTIVFAMALATQDWR
ncbi:MULTISPECIES: hypothetical protein [unclassified Variovorax]|uniref:hypothetical protein n=1 Tax=unclassified Variovorax TaxID=663243 RepID=UPI00076C1BF2|nr:MULTISPECIES: hypothetical protein [unclassified Variovorax]KWT72303.1 hypothetical protein APY03_6328 [Variovorax sp. WDL1]PNG53250.1 hypothetical protein CHC06_04597 [Variovorax sp. B2]PNG53822.1 hypothetical protein CHC07_03644 [Variovorax sp. B4]VTV11281.1 hypothetical protein WDL1CHR_02158 [Variovorax sp. WDL1]